MSGREEKFEKMLDFVMKKYTDTVEKMDKLKAEDKTKTATFHQLMGDKMTYQNIISLYKLFELIQ